MTCEIIDISISFFCNLVWSWIHCKAATVNPSVLVGETGVLSCRVDRTDGDRVLGHSQDGKVTLHAAPPPLTSGKVRMKIYSLLFMET